MTKPSKNIVTPKPEIEHQSCSHDTQEPRDLITKSFTKGDVASMIKGLTPSGYRVPDKLKPKVPKV